MTELAIERSGPERFLSTFPLFIALLRELEGRSDDRAAEQIGRLVAQLWTVRAMSFSVAGMLSGADAPGTQAALVKDIGTRFERDVIEAARALVATEPSIHADAPFACLLAQAILQSPGFTLRGGTNEILRGIIARGLGLR
jgi:acyl-CoA dehydrogenase